MIALPRLSVLLPVALVGFCVMAGLRYRLHSHAIDGDPPEAISEGPVAAPIEIAVFGDYMCPSCAHFVGYVEPLIRRRWVETGHARLIHYDVALREPSIGAAIAARCAAEQGKYQAFHRRLFATQSRWASSERAASGYWRRIGYDLGMDADEFAACMRNPSFREVVTRNASIAQAANVHRLPAVTINGKKVLTPSTDSAAFLDAVATLIVEAGSL